MAIEQIGVCTLEVRYPKGEKWLVDHMTIDSTTRDLREIIRKISTFAFPRMEHTPIMFGHTDKNGRGDNSLVSIGEFPVVISMQFVGPRENMVPILSGMCEGTGCV
jgi:hypothetical protein